MGFVPTVVFVALAGSAAMVKYDVVIESEWFDNIDVLGSGAAQKFAFAVYTGPFMLWWLPYGLMQGGSAWGAPHPRPHATTFWHARCIQDDRHSRGGMARQRCTDVSRWHRL